MTIDPKDVFDNKILQYTLTSETEKMRMEHLTHIWTHIPIYTLTNICTEMKWKIFIFETTPMNTSVQNLSFRTLIPLDMVSIVSFDQAKDKLTMLKCIISEINLLFM